MNFQESAKTMIATLVAINLGLFFPEAMDIVDECQLAINEHIAGNTDYKSINDILIDYLGITDTYEWVFHD